jgi:hypothetical protein
LTMLAEKLVRLDSSSRRVILTALVVVAAAGLYRLILFPFSSQLLAAQHYNSTLDSAIRKSGVLGTTLRAKKAKLDKLVIASERLRNELFTPDEAGEFFASLPAAVRRAGCVVQSVSSVAGGQGGSQNQHPAASLSNPQDGSGISGKKAVVSFIGGYNNIMMFLKEMQTYKRKVWIDSVRMDAAGTAGKLKCQVALTLYCVDITETALYE